MRASIIIVLVALAAIVAADAHKLSGNQGGQQGGQQGGSQGGQQGGQQFGPQGVPEAGPSAPNNNSNSTEANDADSTTTEASKELEITTVSE